MHEIGRLHHLEKRRALLVGTYEKDKHVCLADLNELENLCDTYGLETIEKLACPKRKIDPGLFLGSGKVEEIKTKVQDLKVDIVIFDDEILPQQQRNLEKILECSVIDRTELILGVFAQRAQTKEAKIQIDLATLRYQLPRLRKLWTHLHRQRSGGASGGAAVKGEGEKQIEIDRRIIRRQIEKLQKELEAVKRQRKVQRRLREQAKIPTFAIVGYTNVGKSTLLRTLTDAEVLVEDKLFATLDPTRRKFVLPNKQAILLVDTVGFIRKIPHQLVAAFKSTLEEAVEADVLLHLIDVSNESAEKQAEATMQILKELGASHLPTITVLNKIDQAKNWAISQKMKIKFPKTVPISALKREGLEELLNKITREISRLRKVVHLRIPQSDYALVSKIMEEGKVLSLDYEENDILLEIEIPSHLYLSGSTPLELQ